jgi:hypothetical protein
MLSTPARADDQLPTSVLTQLQTYDKIYSAAITARGHITSPPPFNAPYLPPVTREWVFTRSGDTFGLVQTSSDIEVKYRPSPEPESSRPGISYDKDGNMHMGLVTGRAVYFGQRRSASVDITTTFVVSPSNKLLSNQRRKSIAYSPPESKQLIVPISTVLWTLGRGYTPYLDRVTEVKRGSDGLLAVAGLGSFDSRLSGRWTLTVDPRSQYLVTSAQFFRSLDNSIPFVAVSNSAIKSKGGCMYPTVGTCSIARSLSTLTVTDVEFVASENVLKQAKELTEQNAQPNTSIMDFTVSPPKSAFIEAPRSGGVDAVQPKRFGVLSVVVAANIVAMIMLGAFYLRSRKKKERKA